ncbi:MAG: TrkH family potassium uptake protein [Methanobacteriaceae archaeon]|nr:TrkH family potassium uptake protein [Methanobacteriaceae archaeon]
MIGHLNRTDIRVISEHLGIIFQGVGVAVLIPLIAALIYNDADSVAFIVPGAFSILVGTLLRKILAGKGQIKLKHGMIVAGLAWLWAALIGSFVLMLAVNIDFLNAYFESMSAWTGSGLTIFSNVEILPRSILFLRSLEQWIGGLGVVIVVIGILIRPGTAAARLYKAEARDERIKPNIVNTVKTIWWIYLFYTVLGIILYILAGMPLFDAINNTLTNLSTGGMSINNNNIGAYNNNLIYVITMVLMIIGGTSFLVHYKALKGRLIDVLKDIQFQAMIIILTLFSILMILNTNLGTMNSVFNVISALTCTGSSIQPTDIMIAWPAYSKVIIIGAMMIGCAAGSTTGAIKIIRIVTILKGIYWELIRILSPVGTVIPRKISGKSVSDVEIREAGSYVFLYLIFIFISWTILVSQGYDGLNSLFEVFSAQGNVGLSMGIVSANMPDIAQIALIGNMWIGRLEIIPVLVLLKSFFDVFN